MYFECLKSIFDGFETYLVEQGSYPAAAWYWTRVWLTNIVLGAS